MLTVKLYQTWTCHCESVQTCTERSIPDFGIDLPKQKKDKVQGERTIFLPEVKMDGEMAGDVKLSDVKSSPVKVELEIPSKGLHLDVKSKVDVEEQRTISVKSEVSVGGVEIKTPEKGGKFKMPNVGIDLCF